MLKLIGIIFGCGLAMLIAQLVGRSSSSSDAASSASSYAMMSECDGALAEIAIQYASGSDAVLPVYRDFLRQLPREVIVHVTCPDTAAYETLRAFVGDVSCTLRPIIVKHPITAWSRDRWIALEPSRAGGKIALLAPRGEAGADVWPQRFGDQQVAYDLAAHLPATIEARRSSLYFDGGDLLADRDHVFVTPAVLRGNVQRTVSDDDELLAILRRELGRNVILLDGAPPHHAGMFMMSVGHRTMLVGDPKLGRAHWNGAMTGLPGGPDFSDATQRAFDAVADQAAAAGYRIVRIPSVSAPDGKTYLTYVNVITDHRDGKHIVYLPQYRGVEAMNAAAADVWRALGYEIRTVDCTSTFGLFGNLHCLVNVVRRS